MYSDLDEQPTHQIVAPHSKVMVENPAWTDRYYFSTFNNDGSLILEMGIGAFPNIGIVEGFACASVRHGDFRTQYNVRPTRPLEDKLLPLEAGPLSFKVVEPQRRWRITLRNNPQGVSYDLNLNWEGRPFEAVPMFLKDKQGNVVTHVCHYVQRGKTNGAVQVGGREYHLENATAFRDRSWGIRSPGEGGPARGLLNWVPISAGDDLIIHYTLERQDGKVTYLSGSRLSIVTGEEDLITAVEHDIKFDSSSKIFKSGRLHYSFASGRELDMSMKKLGSWSYPFWYPIRKLSVGRGFDTFFIPSFPAALPESQGGRNTITFWIRTGARCTAPASSWSAMSATIWLCTPCVSPPLR
jgi:hypothetical protein